MSTITQEPRLKVEDVAARLDVSPSTVYRLTGRGELPTVRVGAQLRIDPDAVGRTTALDLGKGRQVLLGRGIEPAGPMRQTPLAHLIGAVPAPGLEARLSPATSTSRSPAPTPARRSAPPLGPRRMRAARWIAATGRPRSCVYRQLWGSDPV